MNKNPTANRTHLDFKVGNAHVLAAWFVVQHGLQVLSRWLTLSIVIGLACQTGNYRLDESLLCGKSGGESMNAARSDAYFTLTMYGFSKTTSLRELVPCIDTILHGAPRSHMRTNGVDMGVGHAAVPSTYDIVQRHSLSTLKALAVALNGASGRRTHPKASSGGRSIVLDWLSMPQSRDTQTMMEAAGLASRACFSRDQLPDACGYLATGWAAMLRSLKDAFQSLECSVAAEINVPPFIATANAHLQLPTKDAVQLTSDQILQLAAAINPDGPGSASWLHSPMPQNLFNAFFARTVAEDQFHDQVHIVVVNTDAQVSFDVTTESGIHWYLAAWLIKSSDAED